MPNGQKIIDPLSLNLYTYAHNNPIMYKDASGHWIETIADVIGLFWSISDMWNDPSWANAGFIAWDVASIVVPIAPGSYVGRGARAAGTIADEIADAARAADRAGDVADAQRAAIRIFSDLAKTSTHYADSNVAVLGKYIKGSASSYDQVAEALKYTYFQMPEATWNKLAAEYGDDMWLINQQFLQQQIDAGKSFLLTHNPFNQTGSYARELQYLSDAGYKIIQSGDYWRAVMK
jgi:signal transduction histidine kinase